MNLDTPLTTRQGVIIASRTLCAFLLIEALLNLSYFPGYIGSVMHYATAPHELQTQNGYFMSYYVRYLAAGVFRLALELFGALWFYRADKGPLGFLLKEKL